MRILCWSFVTVSLSFQVHASPVSPEELFQRGLAAYQAGQYTQARDHFAAILEARMQTVAVLHNLALTNYRLGETAKSMALWRKALNMNPAYRPSRAGRDLLETTTNMRPWESDRAKLWLRRATEGIGVTHVLWFTALALAVVGWLWIRYWAERLAALEDEQPLPPFPGVAAILSFVFLATLGLLALKVNETAKTRATVTASRAQVRSLPTDEGVALYELTGGTEVLVRHRQEGWLHVRHKDGTSGWMKMNDTMITTEN